MGRVLFSHFPIVKTEVYSAHGYSKPCLLFRIFQWLKSKKLISPPYIHHRRASIKRRYTGDFLHRRLLAPPVPLSSVATPSSWLIKLAELQALAVVVKSEECSYTAVNTSVTMCTVTYLKSPANTFLLFVPSAAELTASYGNLV